MESFGYGMKVNLQEKTIEDVEESVDEDSHCQMFQKIKKVRVSEKFILLPRKRE